MAWSSMRERSGKASKLSKKLCEAMELIECVCDEIDEMDEYFGERDDDRYGDREEMMERRGRDRMGRYTRR